MSTLPSRFVQSLPDTLSQEVDGHWRRFVEAMEVEPDWPTAVLDSIGAVWSTSDFVAQSCIRAPAMCADLVESGDLQRALNVGECRTQLDRWLFDVVDEVALSQQLRRFRQREMVRIAWRDLAGWADLEEVLNALSELADACIDGALQRLHDWQKIEWGVPRDGQGNALSLVVLGMGKLGAHELNFSSDVDLIFAFAEEGQIEGPKDKANSEYFLRLGRRLIKAIDEHTGEGFVFRVDMRLRPFGDSGPLVVSFNSMEQYYTLQGREWERYAMIKARPVAGDPTQGAELMALLKPFVYRRYLDYGTFEHLREMKSMISRQVKGRGMEGNIKLGPGGIREIEFMGQAFQMVRGGRDVGLQQRGIVRVLGELARLGQISAAANLELVNAYVFLRKVENRLQAFADKQTQMLPKNERGQARLAFSMGYEDWPSFLRALQIHQDSVQDHFHSLFGETKAVDGVEAHSLEAVWQCDGGDEQALLSLSHAGFEDPPAALKSLDALKQGVSYRTQTTTGRDRMDRLVPMLLQHVAQQPDAHKVLARLINLLEKIAGRSVYLALLIERPMVLEHLVRLAEASPWLAAYVTQHPLLLDELLDPRRLYAPLQHEALAQDLASRIGAVNDGDREAEMDVLRHFKQSQVLRVAAADVVGATPLMAVSNYLTDISEVVLAEAVRIARRDMEKRYGTPFCVEAGVRREAGFAVIAYGKMGGFELGYSSDLDVVLLHDSVGQAQYTDGEHSLDNHTFFVRVAQRMVSMLTTMTSAGRAYEVDMRLRPNGNSGMMVMGMRGFSAYQQDQAWTWEHQALVRARFVAGDAPLAVAFAEIRDRILTRPRDAQALQTEVRQMREKMRDAFGGDCGQSFHIKQDEGGIADIEFLVQYAVLKWAHIHPALTRWTDNIRILESLAEVGVMPVSDARALSVAYRAYRARYHQRVLQDQPGKVADSEFVEHRAEVRRLWREWMGA